MNDTRRNMKERKRTELLEKTTEIKRTTRRRARHFSFCMSSVIGNQTKARITFTTHVNHWGACIHNTHLFSDTTTILAVELTFCQSYHVICIYIYMYICTHLQSNTGNIHSTFFHYILTCKNNSVSNMLGATCLLSGLAQYTVEAFYAGRWIMLWQNHFCG